MNRTFYKVKGLGNLPNRSLPEYLYTRIASNSFYLQYQQNLQSTGQSSEQDNLLPKIANGVGNLFVCRDFGPISISWDGADGLINGKAYFAILNWLSPIQLTEQKFKSSLASEGNTKGRAGSLDIEFRMDFDVQLQVSSKNAVCGCV